jgi:succinyl-CoA synthetase beta subunit
MNLYEFEGKQILSKYGIKIPRSVLVKRNENYQKKYQELGVIKIIVKAQILSGKRGKNNGLRICSNLKEVELATEQLFANTISGQYVAAILYEEYLPVLEEHYLSISYNTILKCPVFMYSEKGGIDVEEIGNIQSWPLDTHNKNMSLVMNNVPYTKEIWACFLAEDMQILEINPLIKVSSGEWIAVDAKISLDEDANFRHPKWNELEPRSMLGRPPTPRETNAKLIDNQGENYYRGTASKYIELEGDIAVLFSGGGASIANMDALQRAGGQPANYTEYSGNPPREKLYNLTKIVLSKPNLRGLWIAGGVANFTNVAETFKGIIDALDEIKPKYPIVIRRAGPFEEEGKKEMVNCKERNNLNMKIFGKETSMSATAKILMALVNENR